MGSLLAKETAAAPVYIHDPNLEKYPIAANTVQSSLDNDRMYVVTDGTFGESIRGGAGWSGASANQTVFLKAGNDYLVHNDMAGGNGQNILYQQVNGAWKSRTVAPTTATAPPAGTTSVGTPTATFVTSPTHAWGSARSVGTEQQNLLGFGGSR